MIFTDAIGCFDILGCIDFKSNIRQVPGNIVKDMLYNSLYLTD